MDFVEINKRLHKKYTDPAFDHLYELCDLTKDEATTLILYACRKTYGINKTVKIVHGLGVKHL